MTVLIDSYWDLDFPGFNCAGSVMQDRRLTGLASTYAALIKVPSIWSHGPNWLVQAQDTWPKLELQLKDTSEFRSPNPVETSLLLHKSNWNFLGKYSSLPKLQRVLAFCLRFIYNAKGKNKRTGSLTVSEVDASMDRIIQLTQARDFFQETDCLKCEKTISNKSKLLSLNPFLDKGILKVGGRLFHSELTPDEKHPMLLPRNHHITSLIIRHEHIRLKHAGSQATLYAVRERFWPIDGRNTTGRVIHQCVPCFYAKPHIFVCLASKATHLELVSDLSTEAFLAALKRFFARRGKSSSLISDNATNFVGASRELAELQDLLLSDEHNKNIQEFLANQRFNWSFIPPRYPDFWGLAHCE
ncbi:uncharacterized protein LOC117169999 [Belonocnema kinseyi]|uniref:uncharacterized protein LOC117169999 n=1 Tax=Belonocnema kinseyi TaxID=2817044 RepID=UPI00143CF41F|nr:uncharacterized protein LOC117169999 [Belonocnema kinseyi]